MDRRTFLKIGVISTTVLALPVKLFASTVLGKNKHVGVLGERSFVGKAYVIEKYPATTKYSNGLFMCSVNMDVLSIGDDVIGDMEAVSKLWPAHGKELLNLYRDANKQVFDSSKWKVWIISKYKGHCRMTAKGYMFDWENINASWEG